MELKIEYMNPADLVPYEGNARSHAEEDVSAIVESIKAFGFNDPIGIWKGNLIIEGHGRLLAAQELGLEKVPVIHLDHLTDVERRAYALAHNKTAELSRWDAELLSLELCNIQDIDMSVFGFEHISPDGFGEDFTLPDGDKPELCTMSFTLHEKQRDLVKSALDLVGDDVAETFGNQNKNGNALYEVVRQWAELKK